MRKFQRILPSLGLVACFMIAGPLMSLAQQEAAAPLPPAHERPELGLSQEQKEQIAQIRDPIGATSS